MRDRYAEYKDSGLEWMRYIPQHWDVVPLFSIAKENKEKNTGMICSNLLSLSYGNVIQKDIENTFGLLPASFETYQIVHEGYTMLRLTDLQNDQRSLRTGYVRETGIITSAYLGLIPSDTVNKQYFQYLLHTYDIARVYYRLGGGLRQSLKYNDLKHLLIVIPPEDEQKEIITYLDTALCKIDELIERNEKLRSLLTRYKRDLIAECVTKGLNKAAPMRPSGEDWIGDVPEHWKITKLKWMFEIVKRIYGEEDRDVLAITQQGIKIKDMESNKGQYAESYATYQVVNVNDFAMNSMDLLTGWVDCSLYEGVTSPDYRVFRFYEDKPQCHAYFKYLFQMCYTNRIFYRLGQGVSNLGRWRLQTEQFRNIKLPHPPVEEQERIAAYLDEKIRQIDAVVDGITSQIQKLKDYRRILIHDVVTGKIKI